MLRRFQTMAGFDISQYLSILKTSIIAHRNQFVLNGHLEASGLSLYTSQRDSLSNQRLDNGFSSTSPHRRTVARPDDR
jgi:hypothetical protein